MQTCVFTYTYIQVTFRLEATATAPFLLMWFQLRSSTRNASLSATEVTHIVHAVTALMIICSVNIVVGE